jgi:protein-disulfide isomerase
MSLKMNAIRILLPLLFAFCTLGTQGAQAQSSPTRANRQASQPDGGITREQAAKIIEELQMIRTLLQEKQESTANPGADPAPGPEKKLGTLGDHVLGSASAPVTLVEFVDLQCPFCAQFQSRVLPELKTKYIETGKLRLAVFDFPLESHVYAAPAAAFAVCAGKQGKYWEVHDTILNSEEVATQDMLAHVGRAAMLDQAALDACLKDGQISAQIGHNVNLARQIGVVGTPTFLLGKSQPTGAQGTMIHGAPSLQAVEERIDALLPKN